MYRQWGKSRYNFRPRDRGVSFHPREGCTNFDDFSVHEMMKWLKRLLLLIALALLVVIGFLLVGVYRVQSRPAWYRVGHLTTQQAADQARSMEDKLVELRNWAQEGTAGSMTITLTNDELESFSEKWASQWKDRYAEVLSDLKVYTDDSAFIVAGHLKGRNILASLQFAPRITPDGQLDPNLLRVNGGTLPLPEVVQEKPKARAVKQLRKSLPAVIEESALSVSALANDAMRKAAVTQLILAMLQHTPSEPYLYIQTNAKASVPVRIEQISVANGLLSMKLARTSPEERIKLLERMKSSPLPD